MQIVVTRGKSTENSTAGVLEINSRIRFYTLEDVDRFLENGGAKVWHKTAIPRGYYPVTIDWSQRFSGLAIHILNVPQFEGVRIHAGNTDKDTDGCILVGLERMPDELFQSTEALRQLTVLVFNSILSHEGVYIRVL